MNFDTERPSSDLTLISNNQPEFGDHSLSVVSLFSGCGGMDLGFKGGFQFLGKEFSANPFDIQWANDINAEACRTYERNLGAHIHCGDIWQLMDTLPPKCDVVIGGFPCQDISVNGKGAGIEGERSGLYRAMVETVRKLNPHVFIAENVKGLLMKHHQAALSQVIKDFSDLGYHVDYRLLNSADFGVPQTRERVFIVGSRHPNFKFPEQTHSREKWISASQAIGDLAALEENEETSHIWSRARRSPEQGNRRLISERPGYTIRAECHGNIQWHYSLPRRISMREAARIQSFPDNFLFTSKLRQTERQVGNAVPPVLAWSIAKSVARHARESGLMASTVATINKQGRRSGR